MKLLLTEDDVGNDDFWGKGGEGAIVWEMVEKASVPDDDFKDALEDDSVDSDFDLPEAPELETEVLGEETEEKKKKSNIYVDPKRKRKTNQKQDDSSEEDIPKFQRTFTQSIVSDRKLRRSTLETSKEAAMQREKAAAMPTQKKPKIQKKFTQEFLLNEAKETEKKNLASYAKMKRIEDDKKKVVFKKYVIKGPKIIETSNRTGSYLTIVGTSKLPHEICSKAPPYITKAICPISGLPAKYLDTLFNTPYATIEAFKIIRQKYIANNPNSNTDTEVSD